MKYMIVTCRQTNKQHSSFNTLNTRKKYIIHNLHYYYVEITVLENMTFLRCMEPGEKMELIRWNHGL